MRKLLSLSSLIAVVLLAALAASPIYGQTGRGGQGLEIAIAAQERHTDALLANPGIVGTAVGYNAGGVPVVKIFIEKAGVAGLPKRLAGVPVVIQVTGRVYALHHRPGHSGGPGGGGEVDPTARFDRPVPIGVSTGHPDITAGTIGARVTNGPNVYALSNNHVYANENQASIGDDVLQPGTYDGGSSSTDVIGRGAAPIVGTRLQHGVVFRCLVLVGVDVVIAQGIDLCPFGYPASDGSGRNVRVAGRNADRHRSTAFTIALAVDSIFLSAVPATGPRGLRLGDDFSCNLHNDRHTFDVGRNDRPLCQVKGLGQHKYCGFPVSTDTCGCSLDARF